MTIALLIARLLLALVFVVAGLTKLVDLPGSRQVLRNFGLPALLANPLGVLLPLAELAVAIALLPTISAWWAAIGALVLVLLFIAGISYNLARGRAPHCHCFGQLYSRPIGWPTLVRNLLLAAVAAFILWQGRTNAGLSAVDWFGTLALMQRIELLVGVVVVALLAGASWLLFQMLRQQGRLLLRIESLETQLAANGKAAQPTTVDSSVPAPLGLPVGSPAPTFGLSGLYGETLTLDALRASAKPVLLVFSDPGCGPCMALLPEVGRWQRDYAAKLTLVLISRGTPEMNRSKATEHGITAVLLQKDREVAEAYKAYGTPSALLVRSDGTIGSSLAQGAEAIRELVAGAVGLPILRNLLLAAPTNGNGHAGAAPAHQPVPPKVGELAPEFSLPDLTGKPVSLSDYRGSKTVVLFWNPGCGFCQRMVEDLKAWEVKAPMGAPKLLMVSTGPAETNAAMELKSTVVLDQGFSTGSKFGAGGTPMAVLVDEEGKLASELAAGAEAVLALARTGQNQVSTT
ncbi:MAG: hypothetical protein NVSMB27_03650 [Ktedonobacteraceae bacterium]